MNTRSTLRAGKMQAGDNLAAQDGDDLLALIDGIATTADGVRVVDFLRERGEATANKISAHAAGRDAAVLRGDVAQSAHEADAARFQREADRLALAVDRATDRVSIIAAAKRRAEGEAAAARAVKKAAEIEALVGDEYIGLGRMLGEVVNKIEAATAELIRDRDLACSAGVECAAKLPHEARFRPEVVEERQVVDRSTGPTVTDSSGRPLDSKPPVYTETRRTERVIVQQRHAPPSILDMRLVLPGPDGGNLVDRNADAGRRHY